MSTGTSSTNPNTLDDEIQGLLDELSVRAGDSDEYDTIADNLVKLYKLRQVDFEIGIKQEELKNKSEELAIRREELLIKNRELAIRNDEAQAKVSEIDIKSREVDIKRDDLVLRNRELDAKIEEAKSPKPLSIDTIVSVAASLVGLFGILGYEKTNVLTSKALGWVRSPR